MDRRRSTTRPARRRPGRGLLAAALVALAACGGPAEGVEAPASVTPVVSAPATGPGVTLAPGGAPASSTVPPTTVPPTTVPATTLPPTTAAPTTTTVAARPGDSVGFSLGLASLADTDEELARDLDAIVAAGARWLRVDVDWSAVEAVEGEPDWSWLDRVVDYAGERGLRVLGLVAYTPEWARPPDTTDKVPPDDPGTFARFAATVAGRYAGRVSAWEIWNEPNSHTFWAPRPDPVAYARLLTAATAAIRAVAPPGTTIVTGGLAPAVDAPNGSEVAPDTFLREMLAHTDAFDAVGAHPYCFPALPTDASTSTWNSFYRLPLLRRALTDAKLDRPVWITEFGAPTGGGRGAVSDELQTEIVLDGLRRATELGWVDRVFLFTHRDSPGRDTDVEAHFGLLRLDGSPKPAYDALAAALRA